jgi:hypothetical protein
VALIDAVPGCNEKRTSGPCLSLRRPDRFNPVATERWAPVVPIWEIIVIWALGAGVAVTLAMLVALAIILWASRKLD